MNSCNSCKTCMKYRRPRKGEICHGTGFCGESDRSPVESRWGCSGWRAKKERQIDMFALIDYQTGGKQ